MPNPATDTARTLLMSLVQLGVRDVFLCPGSRSAPLAFAAAALERAGKIRLHVHHDERVGAFMALGAAKASAVAGQLRPTVVITTSGTATANLHPAVLEAGHAHLPLIALTADRPHELRGVGANQTTDQVGLYGSAVRWAVDIPARDAIEDDTSHRPYLRNLAARAVGAALGAGQEPGPVHLNLALREPLLPDANGLEYSDWETGEWSGLTATVTQTDTNAGVGAVKLDTAVPTVVLAGDSAGPRAREVAEEAGWPLFAEPSSGARSGPNAIGPYRFLLGDSQLAQEIRRVVVFGHATLSRPVQQLLARPDLEMIVVHCGNRWPDAPRRADSVVRDVAVEGAPVGEWLDRWQAAGSAARGVITRELQDAITGPNVAQAVVDATTRGQFLWLGSSNAVRDADLARPWSVDRAPLVAAHRGLAGIDGTASAATGAALATGRPARVLLGDLTFLHDVGALVLSSSPQTPHVQLVVLDDDGGGIFEMLEQGAAEYRADFERIFGTPHGQNLVDIAKGFNWPVTKVTSMSQLRQKLADPPPAGISVLVVAAQRVDRRAENQRLAHAVAEII